MRSTINQEVQTLFKYSNNVILEWCTGSGKTLAAINNQLGKTLVLLAETAHIENWKSEYAKHNKEYLLKDTTLICYNSLKKYVAERYDTIILDEMHHFSSEARLMLLKDMKAKRVIGLSATITAQDEYLFGRVFGKFKKHSIPLNKGIEYGLIPAPSIRVIWMTMDNTRKDYEVVFKRGNASQKITCNANESYKYQVQLKHEYPNLHLTIKHTQLSMYKYLDAICKKAATTKYTGWQRRGSERKAFISEMKTECILRIVNKAKENEKRFIAFLGSTKQAETIGEANAIYTGKDSAGTIEKFNKYLINELYVVKMLTEGQNLPGIEVAIIGQLDGVVRPLVQRIGRGLRAVNPEIIIVCVKDTRDEEYLENLYEVIDKKYIKHETLQ